MKKTHHISRKINKTKPIPRHLVIKLPNINVTEENLESIPGWDGGGGRDRLPAKKKAIC